MSTLDSTTGRASEWSSQVHQNTPGDDALHYRGANYMVVTLPRLEDWGNATSVTRLGAIGHERGYQMQLLLGAYEVSNRAQNIPHPVQYLDCVPSRRNVQVRGIQAVLQAISMSLPRQEGNKKIVTPQPLPTTYQPVNRAATLGFPRRQRSQKDVF